MCLFCAAGMAAASTCDAGDSTQASGGSTGAASSAAVVTDESAILTYIQNGDNWRWNYNTGLGTPVILTYSFATNSNLPDVSDPGNNPYGAQSFHAFTSAQKDNFRKAVKEFTDACGVMIVETNSGGMIDVYNASGSSVGGWAGLPWVNGSYASDVDIVIDQSGNYDKGSYGYHVLLHEIGHALGLDHPFDDGGDVSILHNSVDDTSNTVMSYNYNGASSGLQHLDIAALQTLYGTAALSTGWDYDVDMTDATVNATGTSGQDRFYAATLADGRVLEANVRGGDGDDFLNGGTGDDVLRGQHGDDGIAGGAGEDDLRGGKGSDTITSGADDDEARGGRGSDVIDGGDGIDILKGGRGRDMLDGGAGHDLLIAGRGTDTLTGGSGDDIFQFSASSGTNTITDFEIGNDLIMFTSPNSYRHEMQMRDTVAGVEVTVDAVTVIVEGLTVAQLSPADFDFF